MAIIAMSVAMLLTSCFMPRKAELRRCGKADRLLAKAVWLCPDVLQRDSATLHLPADSARLVVAYRDSVDVDSLLAACAALRDAMALRLEGVGSTPRAKFEPSGTVPVASRMHVVQPAAVKHAVAAIRRSACQWESATDTINGFVITVRNGERMPMITVEQLARTLKAPCPPAIQRPPCPTVVDQLREMGTGLMIWLAVMAVLLYLFLRFVMPYFKPKP